MSKPGKVLKALCKKLGVRLTVKRGKKRMYKSIAVLKAQCKRKKKKKVKKRKRKFGKNTTFKTLKKYAIPASIGAGLGVAGTALGMKVYLNNLYLKILNNEIQPENVSSLILKILDKRFKYQNFIKDVGSQIEREYEDVVKKSRPNTGEITFSIDFNKHIGRYIKALDNLKNRESISAYYEDALMLPYLIEFVSNMIPDYRKFFNKNKYISIKKAKKDYPENFLPIDSDENQKRIQDETEKIKKSIAHKQLKDYEKQLKDYENQKRIQDENEKIKKSIAHKQLKDSIELYNMMWMEDKEVDNVLNQKDDIEIEQEVMLFGKKKRRKRKKKK